MKTLTCDYCLKDITSKEELFISMDRLAPESKNWISIDYTRNGVKRALHVYHRLCVKELVRQADGFSILAPKEISLEKLLKMKKRRFWTYIILIPIFSAIFLFWAWNIQQGTIRLVNADNLWWIGLIIFIIFIVIKFSGIGFFSRVSKIKSFLQSPED